MTSEELLLAAKEAFYDKTATETFDSAMRAVVALVIDRCECECFPGAEEAWTREALRTSDLIASRIRALAPTEGD